MQKRFAIHKHLGTENVSVLMTKNMTAATILSYLKRMALRYIEAVARYSRAGDREGAGVGSCSDIV